MPDIIEEITNTTDTVSGVDPAPRKGKKVAVGIAAGVVALGAGGGGAYAASDYVKNQVNLAVKSPQSYYAWVNENNAADYAKQCADQYRKFLEKNENGQSADVTFKYELSDSAKDAFIDEVIYDRDDMSEEEQELVNIINGLDSFELGYGVKVKKGSISGSAHGNVNDEKLATLDVAFDDGEGLAFLRVPELTEQWLSVPVNEFTDSVTYDEDEEKILNAYKDIMKDPAAYLTPEELETEVARYVGVWNASIEDVTLEKKQTVDIADISVEYTVVSVELNEEKANAIALNMVNEAKQDEIIKKIIVDKIGLCTADEYDAKLDEALEDLTKDAEYEFDDETVTLDTYIDPKGTIRGMGFTGDDDKALFVMGLDGDDVRGECFFTEDGEEQFRAELTATANDKIYSGNIDFSVADSHYDWEADETVTETQKFSVEFTDFEIVNEDLGTFNGSFTFIMPDVDPIAVNCTADGSSQTVAFDLNVEGTDYGKLSFTVGVTDGAEPETPSKDGAFVIDPNTVDDLEFADYVSQDQFDAFISGVLTKIGFSDKLNETLTKEISDELYNTYSYDDSDWDDDDWDYDDSDWDDEDEDSDPDDEDSDPDDEDVDSDSEWDEEAWDEMMKEYYPDGVTAQAGQAFIRIMDSEYNAYYYGSRSDSLAEGVTVADITKDGTYTIALTSETDQYKDASKESPNGVNSMSIEIDGIPEAEDAEITVKSVKFDGKELDLIDNEPYVSFYDGDFEMDVYYHGYEDDNIVNLDDIGTWKTVEITFEIKGFK